MPIVSGWSDISLISLLTMYLNYHLSNTKLMSSAPVTPVDQPPRPVSTQYPTVRDYQLAFHLLQQNFPHTVIVPSSKDWTLTQWDAAYQITKAELRRQYPGLGWV